MAKNKQIKKVLIFFVTLPLTLSIRRVLRVDRDVRPTRKIIPFECEFFFCVDDELELVLLNVVFFFFLKLKKKNWQWLFRVEKKKQTAKWIRKTHFVLFFWFCQLNECVFFFHFNNCLFYWHMRIKQSMQIFVEKIFLNILININEQFFFQNVFLVQKKKRKIT